MGGRQKGEIVMPECDCECGDCRTCGKSDEEIGDMLQKGEIKFPVTIFRICEK